MVVILKSFFQYLLEYSDDNKHGKCWADKRLNKTDVPHDYLQLAASVKGRYVRLTNYNVPDGTFSVADLRIFGNGQGHSPAMVRTLY